MDILIEGGLVMAVTGIVIRYAVNRRRFYRRGAGGLQHFRSYSKAVAVTAIERLFKLIGTVLLAAGVLFLLVGWYKHNKLQERKEAAQQIGQRQ